MTVVVVLGLVAVAAGTVVALVAHRWRWGRQRAATIAAAGGAAAVLALGLATRGGSGPVVRLDARAARWAAEHATAVSTDVARAVTEIGSTTFIVTVSVLVLLFEHRRHPTSAAVWFMLLAVGGQTVATDVLKDVVDRARPAIDPLVHAAGGSFPSGHSAAAAACFAGCAVLLGRDRPRRARVALAAAAGAVAAAVAASRVLLGVHWLSDAGAGLALGWAWWGLGLSVFGRNALRAGPDRPLHAPP